MHLPTFADAYMGLSRDQFGYAMLALLLFLVALAAFLSWKNR